MTETSVPAQAVSEADRHIARTIIAWLWATLSAVAVVVWAPAEQRFEWLTLAIGGTILCAFMLQLGTAQRDGFISRLSYSIVGGSILIALVELVAFLVE